jgi:LysM repeat protein
VAWLSYRIRAGDNLARLSLRSGTSVQAILEGNYIGNRNLLHVGQTISNPQPLGVRQSSLKYLSEKTPSQGQRRAS